MTHPWARAGSHRFPGDPSHAFALLQDPGRAGKISPWRSCRCCPRSTQTEGLSGYIISRLTQGFSIRCLRFTSDVAVSHARTRFRLASCASTGRGSNPLDHFERFQVTSPFSFPGLLLSQGLPMMKSALGHLAACAPMSRTTSTHAFSSGTISPVMGWPFWSFHPTWLTGDGRGRAPVLRGSRSAARRDARCS